MRSFARSRGDDVLGVPDRVRHAARSAHGALPARGRVRVATLSALALGLVMGYGAAVYRFHWASARLAPAPAEAPEAVEQRDEGSGLDAAVVEVRLLDATGSPLGRSSGALIGPERLMVLPLARLDGVSAARLEIAGDYAYLGRVRGADPTSGLAAVETGLGRRAPALALADGAGTLYLGRELLVVGAHEQTHGYVDSPAQLRPRGSYIYEVRLDDALSGAFAALLAPETGELVGLVVDWTSRPGVYTALDAAAIDALFGGGVTSGAPDLASFAREFFETTAEGKLYRLERAAAAAAWPAVVELARELIDLGWFYRESVTGPLEEAYLGLAAEAAAEARVSDALAYLDEAAEMLGPSPQRALLQVKVLRDDGQVDRALERLEAAFALGMADQAMLPLMRSMLLESVRAEPRTTAAMSLLERGIGLDPTFGAYHAELGRLLFQQGRYREALSELQSAVQMDGSLAGDLRAMIATARQRLNTPQQTVAPVLTSGSILYVHASVSGIQRRLRFILDTGASYTAISAEVARGLAASQLSGAPRVALTTANGIVQAPLLTVRAVDLNGAMVQNVEVVVLDSLGPFDGLLGLSFLDHFDIDIDRSAGQIVLARR